MPKGTGWRDIPRGGLIIEAGNSVDYKTGGWRAFRPVRDVEKCTNCLLCWVFCPDSSILVQDEKMIGFDSTTARAAASAPRSARRTASAMVEESAVLRAGEALTLSAQLTADQDLHSAIAYGGRQMRETLAIDGNAAVAQAMRQINPDVVAAYPITPQTATVQTFSQFVADGLVNTEFVPVESEHSAMSACVGAAAAGARVMTATSSAAWP